MTRTANFLSIVSLITSIVIFKLDYTCPLHGSRIDLRLDPISQSILEAVGCLLSYATICQFTIRFPLFVSMRDIPDVAFVCSTDSPPILKWTVVMFRKTVDCECPRNVTSQNKLSRSCRRLKSLSVRASRVLVPFDKFALPRRSFTVGESSMVGWAPTN